MPLADAAKLTAQVIKGFGREAEDAGIMVDQMVKTTTKSGMAIEDLAGAMQYASSAAQNMDVDFTSTLATLGLIKNVIPSAEVAGSAFQILTARLSKPTNQRKLRQNLGIDVIDQATGEFRGFGALLLDISSKFGSMKGGERAGMIQDIFGPRGMKAIMPLMTQLEKGITTETGKVLKGQEAWQYWMNTLDPDKVAGFAEEMNNMKLDTLNGQLQLLSGSLQTFQIELGKGTAALSKSAVKYGLKAFNAFLEIFTKLPKPVKNAVSGFLVLSGTLIKVIGGFFILKGLMSLLDISFGGVLLTIGKILLLAVPLTLLFSALGVGIYGVYRTISKNFGKAGDETASFFEKLKLGYRAVTDLISDGALSKAVIEDMKQAKFQGVADFIGTFGVWLGKAKEFFKGVVDGFDAGLRRLTGPWNEFKEAVQDAFGSWFDNAQRGSKSLSEWEGKGKSFGATLSGFSKTIIKMMTKSVEMGQRFSEWASDFTMADMIDEARELADTIQDVLNGLRWLLDKFGYVGHMVDIVGNFGENVTFADLMRKGEGGPLTSQKLIEGSRTFAEGLRRGSTSIEGVGEVPSSAFGFESDVQRFVGRRARRLETLQKAGQFEGKDEALAALQRVLFVSAVEAGKKRAADDKESARRLEKQWDGILKRMELSLVNAMKEGGGLKGLKLVIGEHEFGRLVDQAGETKKEDSYDWEDMGPPAP